jgi:hypothetical protein
MSNIVNFPPSAMSSKSSTAVRQAAVERKHVKVANLLPAEDAVNTALAAIGRLSNAEFVFGGNPELREVAIAGAYWLTSDFPSRQGEPLLQLALERAIDGFYRNTGPYTNRSDAMLAWLEQFTTVVSEVLAYGVYGVDKNGVRHYWEVLSMPISDWAAKHKLTDIEWALRPVSDPVQSFDSAKTYFSCHIMDYSMVREMRSQGTTP